MILSCLEGKPLPVYGARSNVRDCLHVDDHGEGLIDAGAAAIRRDAAALRGEIDWQPRYDIESGLRETVAWFLENQDWIDGMRSGEYREWVARNYGER